jgi:uncharacterized protein YcbK (DUF882 family)
MKFLKDLFYGVDGKISWTAVLVSHAILLFWTVYIHVFILGRELTEALLIWTLEVMILFVAPRPFQRSFAGLIDGVAKVRGKKESESTETDTNKTDEVRKSNQKKEVKPRVAKATNYESPFFQLSEFDCKSGAAMPDPVRKNIIKLIQALEVIREACGNKKILITSGYRSPAHNASVGGEKNSQHLYGKAADFKVQGMSASKVADVVEKLISEGRIPAGGVGRYKSWTHYDIRGQFVQWNG